MGYRVIVISERAFLLINGPLIFFSLTANIFFVYCMNFPSSNRKRLKQPLKTLLGILVWSSLIYCVFLIVLYSVFKESNSFLIVFMSWAITLYFMHNNMTSAVWLSFYYYIQIVPTRRALFIWVKRNIKSLIYVVLLIDGVMSLLDCAFFVAEIMVLPAFKINGTRDSVDLFIPAQVFHFTVKVHIVISLCIMTVSSFSTVNYLRRHIRNVACAGSSFSASTLQSQMRAAITGISQGLLYFLFGSLYIFETLTAVLPMNFILSAWISLTATTLYVTGTTVNLGIGQVTFRQRAAGIWKTLKTLCGVGMATNDVKAHSSQLTLGEIVNTVTADV